MSAEASTPLHKPRERLLEIWRIAQPLCALHQAISYQAILRNTEASARPAFESAIPAWCGTLLKTLDEMS